MRPFKTSVSPRQWRGPDDLQRTKNNFKGTTDMDKKFPNQIQNWDIKQEPVHETVNYPQFSVPACPIKIKQEQDSGSSVEDDVFPFLVVKFKQERMDESGQCTDSSPDSNPQDHVTDNELRQVIERKKSGIYETRSDEAPKSTRKDCTAESDQMLFGHEITTSHSIDDTSCLLQSNFEIKVHQKRPNAGKPFTCVLCGAVFAHCSSLSKHKKLHTGEKPYKCNVCGVGFSESGNLKKHIRIHTGEKPYKCDVCGVRISASGSLTKHLRTHTGEKPYKCDLCGVGFFESGSLKKHLRIHTGEKPYKCDVCGMGFSESGHLTRHMRTHTGEKPYKCDVCSVGFSERGHLTRHMRTHTGEKPYKCDVCGVAFSDNGALNKHKKKHVVCQSVS